MSRLRHLNPMRLVQSGNFSYTSLPTFSRSSSPSRIGAAGGGGSGGGGGGVGTGGGVGIGIHRGRAPRVDDWRAYIPRITVTRILLLITTSLVIITLTLPHPTYQTVSSAVKNTLSQQRLSELTGGGFKDVQPPQPIDKSVDPPQFPWQNYFRLDSYYNGVRTLVPPEEHTPGNRYALGAPPRPIAANELSAVPKGPSMDPEVYNPYPDYSSAEYLSQHQSVQECFIDQEETVRPPDVYAYPGLPQNLEDPLYGSYTELGLEDGKCFERYGRLGPYGYGYDYDGAHKGQGPGAQSEKHGSEKIFEKIGHTDYSTVDWGSAQKACYEKNKKRFEEEQSEGKTREQRHAYVLRTWTGYKYNDHQILTLRAMISELAIRSGGQYDVHLLLHVKDNSIPIWADQEVYRQTLEANVPREFWNITTLWSEQQMTMYYPGPWENNFVNRAGSSIYGVYRSAHFALQWFAHENPQYDFYWNWEMDLRYTGHYWDFNERIGNWAKEQPRKGMWERNARFYFPHYHGTWANFTKFVEWEIEERDRSSNDVVKSGPMPVWGPVNDFKSENLLTPPPECQPPHTYERDNYDWGVGEDADIITFNPIFDPAKTNWVFKDDVTGYPTKFPIPPRRTAIVTVARLSKRLLDIMHAETWKGKHSMFPEMWPPSVALHHGLKAVYVPHPVHFDRDWDLEYMNQIFNYPREDHDSPFGWGEHNLLGSSFYYNSGFSGALWRRWLGERENEEGGHREEERGTGRMCLRPILHHPIKYENGPT